MTGVFYGCLGYPNVFKQKYFLAIPLSHIFGFVRNMLTSYATGSCLYICHNLKNIFKEMMLFNPTILVTVPALAEMGLNAYKSFRKSLFGNQLQSIICGSASVPPYLIKEYKKININVYPGYGMTETSNLVSGNPEFEKKPQSVGFIYDGQTYKIVNGELWLKGNNIFKKYYGDYAETRATFKHGYLKTGDLARVDKDGFLYILGRTNDVIVLSSGIKIHPADIEAQFNALDCVQDSLIYQQKSETEASQLILEVVPRKMFLTENKIKNAYDYCINELCKVNSNLPTEKQVNKFVIRNLDFDRSPSIKIKKPRVISVDQQKIINKLTKIISKDLKKSIKNINLRLETRLRDEVGLSSINMLYLVIIIEDTFNIKFKNVGVSYFTTVYDIVKYIFNH